MEKSGENKNKRRKESREKVEMIRDMGKKETEE